MESSGYTDCSQSRKLERFQTTEHKSGGISQAQMQILFGNKGNQLESASKPYQEISRKFAATRYIQNDVLFQAESVRRCSFWSAVFLALTKER